MTRVFRIQNLEEAESLRPLIVAMWPVDGKPVEYKIDPQRDLMLSIHDASPMVSIGKQPFAENELPGDSIIATAKSAAEIQKRLDEVTAENQQLRVDKDGLATEVERLTSVAAEHKPAEDSELSAQLAQALADNKVLAEAYEKRFEELKAAEAERDQARNDATAAVSHSAELQNQIDALTAQLHAIEPPPPPVNTDQAKPLDRMNKDELVAEANRRGIVPGEADTKAQIIAKLQG